MYLATYLLIAQFTQVRDPSCSDGISVYSCARNDGLLLNWRFEGTEVSRTVRGSPGEVTVIPVGSSVVNVTINSVGNISDPYISVTANISYYDAVRLNGTRMECNGDSMYIRASLPSKY